MLGFNCFADQTETVNQPLSLCLLTMMKHTFPLTDKTSAGVDEPLMWALTPNTSPDCLCIFPVVSIVSACTRNKGVIALNHKGHPRGSANAHKRENKSERESVKEREWGTGRTGSITIIILHRLRKRRLLSKRRGGEWGKKSQSTRWKSHDWKA